MSGGSTQTQTQSQHSTTDPWAPARPMLQDILGQLGGANLGPTAGQLGAINLLGQEAGLVPNFGAAGADAVSRMFGSSTAPQQGMLNEAFSNLRSTLSPMTAPSYTNPMSAPGMGDALKTMNEDITNQVNGQFAAAGRDMSPGNTKALARGLSQGEGGLLTNEFNALTGQQLGAANELFGGAGSTAGALTGQQQVPLENAMRGMGAASMIPGLETMPGAVQLGAASTAAGAPIMNLPGIEGLTAPIAGLGSESSGTATGTTTTSSPWYMQALSGGLGGLGLLGGMGAFGSSGWLNPMSAAFMFSDANVKENIKPVGMLFDDTPVFSYSYKDDPTRKTRIGLIAQDIEQRRPDAVREFGGVKAVDYRKATERARTIGMLHDLSDLWMAA